LFVRTDNALEQWKTIDPLAKSRHKYPLHLYKAGSNGPEEQNSMLERDGRKWWSDEMESCPYCATKMK